MTKEEFKPLYTGFLADVIKFTPANEYFQKKLFDVYFYLNESELRSVFDMFKRSIAAGRFTGADEPSLKDWRKVTYHLFLDKAAIRGLRHKPVTPSDRETIGGMAAGMSKHLSSSSDEDLNNFIKQNQA